MADSIRESIIKSIIIRLADILITKGYQTNCGVYLYRTTKRIDENFLPACVVWPGDETAETIYDALSISMPIRIELLSQFGEENPSVVGERLLADIQDCLLSTRQAVTFTSGVSSIAVGQTLTGYTSGATGYVESITLSGGSFSVGNAAGTIIFRRNTGKFSASELLKIGTTTKATVGTSTLTSVITNVLGGYAQGINYTGGGYNSFPETGESVIIVSANFTVKYTIKEGNPYSQ